MFWTDLLSIIRSLDTVFTATGICHTTIYVASREIVHLVRFYNANISRYMVLRMSKSEVWC